MLSASPLRHGAVICIEFALLALLYGQTQSFGFVYFDDGEYVPENAYVLAGLTADSIHWAFTTFYMSNWHPLTWISHMVDVQLFGPAPGWAHLHNAFLHGINSLLVYTLLLKLSGNWWKAFLLSLIFLVHPLHVESVAWIAERKDLLCAMFFLLSLLFYDAYRAGRTVANYLGLTVCFVLALMAKPMAVTLPVVFLILDRFVYRSHFQSGQGSSSKETFNYLAAVIEKLPLLTLSAASCVVTIYAQQAGNSVASLEAHSLVARCVTAASAYVTYLKQWLLPIDLVAFYPVKTSLSIEDGVVSVAILSSLALLFLIFAKKFPLVITGMAWYLITLLPVIGLLQVGTQAHADRYMYVPSVGLLIASLYILPNRGHRYFQLGNILALLFVVYLSILCFWQVGYWRDRHTLFTHVYEVVGSNFKVHSHLGQDYLQRGLYTEARQHSQAAMLFQPDMSTSYLILGDTALAEQDFISAEKYYRISLTKHHPPVTRILINMGIAMAEQGKIADGIEALEDALIRDPDSREAQANLRHYRAKLETRPTP